MSGKNKSKKKQKRQISTSPASSKSQGVQNDVQADGDHRTNGSGGLNVSNGTNGSNGSKSMSKQEFAKLLFGEPDSAPKQAYKANSKDKKAGKDAKPGKDTKAAKETNNQNSATEGDEVITPLSLLLRATKDAGPLPEPNATPQLNGSLKKEQKFSKDKVNLGEISSLAFSNTSDYRSNEIAFRKIKSLIEEKNKLALAIAACILIKFGARLKERKIIDVPDPSILARDYAFEAAKGEDGILQAQIIVGTNSLYGLNHFARDPKLAFEYLTGASKFYVEAKIHLAVQCYQFGIGTAIDLAKGAQLLEEVVNETQEKEAFRHLGYCYDTGRGVAQDKKKAKELYQKGAEKGDILCKVAYAKLILLTEVGNTEQEIKQCLKYIREGVKARNLNAYFVLGLLYKKGFGRFISQNYKEAVLHLQEAANQESNDYDITFAAFEVAELYLKGQGVVKDPERAFFYYKKAAERNHISAKMHCGLMLYLGDQIKQDHLAAQKIFEECAKDDDNTNKGIAELYLGLIFKHKREYPKAMQHFRLAQEMGNHAGSFETARCLCHREVTHESKQKGEAINQTADYKEAVEILNKLILIQDDSDSSFVDIKKSALALLAECYFYGKGIEKNLPHALKLYSESAELGDIYSILFLKNYYDPNVPTANPTEYIKWLSKCVDTQTYIEIERHLKYVTTGNKPNKEVVETPLNIDYEDTESLGYYYNQLGTCYLKRIGTASDLAKAIEMYRKGAQERSRSAKLNYIRMTLNRETKQKEASDAVTLLQSVKEPYAFFAKNFLAWCALEGIGMKRDINKVLAYMHEVVQENPELHQTRINMDPKLCAEAQLFEMQLKHPSEIFHLALCFLYGWASVPLNIEKACTLFVKVTTELPSHALARFLLDKELTQESCRSLATVFHALLTRPEKEIQIEAAIALGICYYEGRGVIKDTKKAFGLLKKVYDLLGNQASKAPEKVLQYLVESYRGMIINDTAIDLGLVGQANLDQTVSGNSNLAQALEISELLLTNSSGNHIDICAFLGEHLLAGTHIQYNPKRAIELLRKSMNTQGENKGREDERLRSLVKRNPAALYHLALLHFEGSFKLKTQPEIGFLNLHAAVKLNYIPAIEESAWCLFMGLGVSQNIQEAFNFCEKARALETSSANVAVSTRTNKRTDSCLIKLLETPIQKVRLGLGYLVGLSVSKNTDKAKQIFSELPGDTIVNELLNMLREPSLSVKNRSLLIDAMKSLCDCEDLKIKASMVATLALFHIERKEFSEQKIGYEILSQSAFKFESANEASELSHLLRENDRALCHLASLYLNGKEGLKLDKSQAVKLVQLAVQANPNNIKAKESLAVSFMAGLGIDMDLKNAIELFKQCAASGSITSQNNLGWTLMNHSKLETQPNEALTCFEKAEAQGSYSATLNIAWLKLRKLKFPKDLKQITELFKTTEGKLANKKRDLNEFCFIDYWGTYPFEEIHTLLEKDPNSIFYLGLCYWHGFGVEKNFLVAEQLWRYLIKYCPKEERVSRIVLETAVFLARHYKYGKGLKQNMNDAIDLLRFAAKHKHPEAMVWLGHLYEDNQISVDAVNCAQTPNTRASNPQSSNVTVVSALETKASDEHHLFNPEDLQEDLQETLREDSKEKVGKQNSQQMVSKQSNQQKALELYQQAADMGNPQGMTDLALRLSELREKLNQGENKLAGEQDESEHLAARSFQLTKQANEVTAGQDPIILGNLALCFVYGEGTKKDLDEAAKLYRVVADHPNSDETSKTNARDYLTWYHFERK